MTTKIFVKYSPLNFRAEFLNCNGFTLDCWMVQTFPISWPSYIFSFFKPSLFELQLTIEVHVYETDEVTRTSIQTRHISLHECKTLLFLFSTFMLSQTEAWHYFSLVITNHRCKKNKLGDQSARRELNFFLKQIRFDFYVGNEIGSYPNF